MNVAKIVIVPKTKLVCQKIVLTHASVQPVDKMQTVMQLDIEPSAHVLVDCKEIHMCLVFLLAAGVTLIARTGSNVIKTPKSA